MQSFLVVCIAAGEVFALLSTAERLTAAREASQAPLRQAVEARQKLETRVARQRPPLRRFQRLPPASRQPCRARPLPTRPLSPRAPSAAALRTAGCCCRRRQIRTNRKSKRRGATWQSNRTRLEQAVTDARADLAAFKAPPSASPLADRIGWPAWVLDLVMAALGSIAANGLACALMVFGSHRKVASVKAADATPPESTRALPAPETAPEPLRPCRWHQGRQRRADPPSRPFRRGQAVARRHQAGKGVHGGEGHPHRR